MATFHFSIKSGKRGTAAEHASYNARNGKKYADRNDVIFTNHCNLPSWAEGDSAKFWRTADKYERVNAATYRELEIALPNELATKQLVELALELAQRLVGDKTYQVSIHCPTSSIEAMPNPHAHIMFSDRMPDGLQRPPEQAFKRYDHAHPERGGCKKDSGGRSRMELRNEVLDRRETVARTINEALQEAGFEARVDHRSLRQQGASRQPERHLGPAAVKAMSLVDRVAYVDDRKTRAAA